MKHKLKNNKIDAFGHTFVLKGDLVKEIRNYYTQKILEEFNLNGVLYRRNNVYKHYTSPTNDILHKQDIQKNVEYELEKGGSMATGRKAEWYGINYNIVYEKPGSDIAWTEVLNAQSEKEAREKFAQKHPTCKILSIDEQYASGGSMATGGKITYEEAEQTAWDDIDSWSDEDIADYLGIPVEDIDYGYKEQVVEKLAEQYIAQGHFAKGGGVEDLEKELHKLQRDLNSSRLQTYIKSDNSEEAMALKREREVKLARFNEVLRLLREKDRKLSGGSSISTNPKQYFQALSTANIPSKVSNYITTEINTDADIDLLDEQDEDFVSLKNIVDEVFPNAFKKPEPVKNEPTKQDYEDAINGAEIQLEFVKGKEKKNLKESIDGLKIMQESTNN